jgi:hypothetical protein
MRNEPKPLTANERVTQDSVLRDLEPLAGTDAVVEVHYIKRDGNKSSSTGKVAFFNGKPGFDTGSVTIDTADKGPRTINLHRIVAHRKVRL